MSKQKISKYHLDEIKKIVRNAKTKKEVFDYIRSLYSFDERDIYRDIILEGTALISFLMRC